MPISYAPTSWNPTLGCTPVSEACKNCWARTLHNQRHKAWKRGAWPKAPPQYWRPFSKVRCLPHRLSEPLRWRKPRTVAVCFMGDLFHEQVPDEFIDRVFATMAICGARRQTCKSGTRCQHENGVSQGCWHYGDGFDWPTQTFLLLTKRADRMRDYLTDTDVVQRIHDVGNDPEWGMKWEDPPEMMGELGWPLPNVFLGVTAESQRMADERIPLLLDTPGKHWVSLEPLLGPINIEPWIPLNEHSTVRAARGATKWGDLPRLDGVVVGGESGPGHRPMEVQWAKDIVDQCTAAGIPAYFKQRAASRPGQPSGIPMLDGAKETLW